MPLELIGVLFFLKFASSNLHCWHHLSPSFRVKSGATIYLLINFSQTFCDIFNGLRFNETFKVGRLFKQRPCCKALIRIIHKDEWEFSCNWINNRVVTLTDSNLFNNGIKIVSCHTCQDGWYTKLPMWHERILDDITLLNLWEPNVATLLLCYV